MKLTKLTYSIYFCVVVFLLSPYYSIAQKHSVGINIAMLAVGSVNIEFSKAFSQKLTVHLPLSWNPVTFNNNRKIKHLMLQPGIRWWKWHSYSGFFGGINLTTGIFNIGAKNFRYYGKGAGTTISIGYAKMMSKSWNIEAEAGLYSGWVKYDKYRRKLCGDYEGSWSGLILFPSKISLSIIYIL